MTKVFSAAVPLFVTALVLLGLYAGSYLFLVRSVASPVDPLTAPRVARYRVGGVAAELLFLPAEQIDRNLRRDYWTTPDCLRDWE